MLGAILAAQQQSTGFLISSVTLNVVSGAGTTCDESNRSAWVCPSLRSALAAAAGLENTAAVVSFDSVVAVKEPLELKSAASPATLKLQGSGEAAIDGQGVSALLRVSGGGAVSVAGVTFKAGFVPFLKSSKLVDYGPVTVGFPNPMKLPTTFSNCRFLDGVGAYGGGVALHHGLTVFEGCDFINCSSYGDGGPDVPHQHGGGGALYNIGGHLTLRRSRFVNSTCSDPPGAEPGSTGGHNGGAVLSMQGAVEAHDCDFIGGTAGQAGALYLFLYASLLTTNSRFVNNRALSIANHSWASGTGGAIFMDRGWASVTNATFDGNAADLAGGALYAWNAHGVHNGSPLNITVRGGAFVRNEARTQWGGAVANWHSTVLVDGARLDGNEAAAMGGALWTDAESASNLTRCTLTSNNTAPEGRAVWSHPKGSTSLAEHNTFLVDTPRQAAEEAKWFSLCKVEKGGLDVRIKKAQEQEQG